MFVFLSQNVISITTPEQEYTLYTSQATERSEWFHAFQNAIKQNIRKADNQKISSVRTSSYKFVKHPIYKGATYSG